MKIVRKQLVVIEDDIEIALYETQALDDTVCLKEMCLGKDQHHETGKQFLIFYQFHVALRHLGTKV